MLESRGSCTEQIYQFGFLALFFQKKGGARASEGLPTHMQERISPRWWRTKDGLKGNIEETSGEEGTQSRLKVKRRKQTLKTGRLLKPFRDLLYEGRIFVGGMPFYSVYRDVTGLYVRECTLRVMRQDQSNTSRCECLPQLLLKKYPLVVPSQKQGFPIAISHRTILLQCHQRGHQMIHFRKHFWGQSIIWQKIKEQNDLKC